MVRHLLHGDPVGLYHSRDDCLQHGRSVFYRPSGRYRPGGRHLHRRAGFFSAFCRLHHDRGRRLRHHCQGVGRRPNRERPDLCQSVRLDLPAVRGRIRSRCAGVYRPFAAYAGSHPGYAALRRKLYADPGAGRAGDAVQSGHGHADPFRGCYQGRADRQSIRHRG